MSDSTPAGFDAASRLLSNGDDVLGTAYIRLEQLSRDCFERAGTWWQQRASAPPIDDLHADIRDELAKTVGAIVVDYRTSRGLPLDTESIRVFLAPNYRGIRGRLQRVTPSSQSRTSLDVTEDPSNYAHHYGSLAEGAVLATGSEQSFFMPVAYWVHRLYEHEMAWGARPDEKLEISGFSKWFALHEFMECHGQPVYGFHFSFEDIVEGYRHGLVGVRFQEDLDPSRTALTITDQFLRMLEGEGCRFPAAKTSFLPEFPIITGGRAGQYDELAKALFSIFFHSNFPDLLAKQPAWLVHLERKIEALQLDDPLRAKAREHLTVYRDALGAHQSDRKILAFRHYFALLLNPGLSFEVKPDGIAAPLGTLNLYTNTELPFMLVAIIRKYLESIYHLLRDLEEWDEAKREGSRQAGASFAHELKRVSLNLENLVQPASLRAGGYGPPLFSKEHQSLTADAGSAPLYGTIRFRDDVPPAIVKNLGVCFHPPAVKSLASLLGLWCQADDSTDVWALTGANPTSSVADLVQAIWTASLRLLALSSPPAFYFRTLPGGKDKWTAAEAELGRLDSMRTLADKAGLRLEVTGDLSQVAVCQLLSDPDLSWLARALLAILRDYSLHSSLSQITLDVVTLALLDRGEEGSIFCQITIGVTGREVPSPALTTLKQIRKRALEADPGTGKSQEVVKMCLAHIDLGAAVDRTLDKTSHCASWKITLKISTKTAV